MADTKSPVYIGIPSHVEIRRDLLLGSKELLGALKAYEAAKEARTRRVELTFELHKVMDEIGVLTKKIRLALPKPPAKLAFERAAPLEEEKPSKKSKKAAADKLSNLDSELTRIEMKLKKLS